MERNWYEEEIRSSKQFSDIFKIVKKSVFDMLGRRRSGLMLYLSDLPLNVGAYHGFGSNTIVLNRMLLKIVEGNTRSREELNSYVYVILLHEYLHSLGYLNEAEVRRLTYLISMETFGSNHPTVRFAQNPFLTIKNIPLNMDVTIGTPELVMDFEKQDQNYYI